MAQVDSRVVEPPESGWNVDDPVPALRSPPETKQEAKATSPTAEPRQAAKAILPSAGTHAKVPALPSTLEPPLNVAALKARLRETNAMGVFTKLALKNQVDDLLKAFQVH